MIATIVSWFTALFSWIARFFEWFTGLFKDFMEFVLDLPIVILKGFLDGVIYVLAAIPVPSWIEQYSLGGLFSQLPDTVTYFVAYFGIPQGLALLGLGVAFRLTRKALTLGQW